MSIIMTASGPLPCCAAPPKPDPAEPPCSELADDSRTLIAAGIAFAFCSQACMDRFLAHDGWATAIARDVTGKL